MVETSSSIEIFRRFCASELEAATKSGQAESLHSRRDNNIFAVKYETPGGLEIYRYAGGRLIVEVDTGELDPAEAQRQLTIDFSVTPPEIIELTTTDEGTTSQTIAIHDHDEIAEQLMKYVTLLV